MVRTRARQRRPRAGLLPLTRRNLLLRDRNECQYCGARGGDGITHGDSECSTSRSYVAMTIDHVVPLSKGGEHSWSNCVIACSRCNARKGNLMPKEAARIKGIRLSKRPEQPTVEELYHCMKFRPGRKDAPNEWLSWLPES